MCKCERLMSIGGKCNDLASFQVDHLDIDHNGYMPYVGNGIGGDYINLTICMDCGKVQNWKPITDEAVLANEEFEELFEQRRLAEEEKAIREHEAKNEPAVITPLIIEKNKISAVLADAYGKDWKTNVKVLRLLRVELNEPDGKLPITIQAINSILEDMF